MSARTPASDHPAAPRSLLVALVSLMAAGPVLNYGVTAASAEVVERMQISAAQLGLLASLVFGCAAVVSSPLGHLADRLGLRWQVVVICGSSIVALVVGGLAPNYPTLVVAALVTSVPLAICNPTTNRILAQQVPTHQRTSWIGVKQSGVQAAQLFAGLFFPAMTLWLGWTGAALVAALLVVGLLVQALLVVRPVVPTGGEAGSASAPGPTSASRRRPAAVWYLTGIAFTVGIGIQATNVYLPLFAVDALGQSLVIGGLAATVTGVIGVMSRIAWGRQIHRGVRPTTLLIAIAIGALFSALALLAADEWHLVGLFWLGAVLLGGTALGANVVINATVMRVVPPGQLGKASGINSAGMYAGFAVGPIAMGLLRDATGDFQAGWLMAAAAYAAAMVVAWQLRRQMRRHPV